MLNKLIRCDLHIHSAKSSYKEGNYKNNDKNNICSYSNIGNINTLIEKLRKYNISLFSITDHNTYDFELYKSLSEKIKSSNDLNLLSGAECDVKLDPDKKPAHIIVIFNASNENEMKNIESAFNAKTNDKSGQSNLNKDFFFNKSDFEDLLKNIGLDTILIVHQKHTLDSDKGDSKSLSEAVNDSYKYIEIGYVDALEYQKPHVEGIIKNCLRKKEFDKIATITGSDCHDWRAYPQHDLESSKSKDGDFYFPIIKALPTFKGLLLALTSVDTRFNPYENKGDEYLKSIKINDSEIELDSGINAIIGENGAGKSALFEIIANNESKHKYIKSIKNVNKISFSDFQSDKIIRISQNELINNFNESDNYIFSEFPISGIDYSTFTDRYSTFKIDLFKYFQNKIDYYINKNNLNNLKFILRPEVNNRQLYYVVIKDCDISQIANPYKTSVTNFEKIIKILNDEIESKLLNEKKDKLNKIIGEIKELYSFVSEKSNEINRNNNIKTIITQQCENYNLEIAEKQSNADKEKKDYLKEKEDFCKDIKQCIHEDNIKLLLPAFPNIHIEPASSKRGSYKLVKNPKYNEQEINRIFLEKMFVNEYRDYERLSQIDTYQNLSKAVYGATKENRLEIFSKRNENYEKFEKEIKQFENVILTTSDSKKIGKTLGELSLVYIKYKTENCERGNLFMIDQPEDNLSSKNIANYLVKYFNRIRYKTQIILVTHNPILVVNLDVDNVIYLENNNGKITLTSGCLEDEKNNILNIVADVLDGGKETIERRLKIYGKK